MQNSDGVCTIDEDHIKTSCPIVLATFQEVSRFHGITNSVHIVLEDHTLDSQYLLQKGSTVMMPAPVEYSIPIQDHDFKISMRLRGSQS